MANEQNLRPPFTPEEAREMGKKGAEASARARRRKKSMAETLRQVLNEQVKDEKQLTIIAKSGMPVPKKPTYRDFLVASVLIKSIKRGQIDDLTKIMGIVGEPPVQSEEDALKKARELLGGVDSAID